jgi:hypothetical protein
MGSPNIWRRLEGVGVFLVALHSFAIGIMLIFATAWVLGFAGWDEVSHLFFPASRGPFTSSWPRVISGNTADTEPYG